MGSAYQFHSWRVFVLVCAFPSVFAIGALTTMPESPRFFLEVSGAGGMQGHILLGGWGVQAGTPSGWWDGGELGRDPERVAEMERPRQGPQVGDGDGGTQAGTFKWVMGPRQEAPGEWWDLSRDLDWVMKKEGPN